MGLFLHSSIFGNFFSSKCGLYRLHSAATGIYWLVLNDHIIEQQKAMCLICISFLYQTLELAPLSLLLQSEQEQAGLRYRQESLFGAHIALKQR